MPTSRAQPPIVSPLRPVEDRAALLRVIVDRARSAIAVWESFPAGAPARLVYVNAAYVELTGFEPDDVLGRPPGLLVGPQGPPGLVGEIEAALRQGETFERRITIRTKGGEERWVESVFYAVPAADDGPTFVVGAYRSLDELLVEEQRFRALVENISDIVALLDASGTIRYVTPSVEELIGIGASEVVGHRFFDFIDAGRDPDAPAVWQAVLDEPDVVHGPMLLTVHDPSGGAHQLEMLLTNRLADPAIHAVIATARDVTARVEAEASLRRREEWAQTLVRQGSDLVILADEAGTMTWVGPNSIDVIGIDADDLVGRAAFELVHPDDLGEAIDGFVKEAGGDMERNPPIVLRVGRPGAWRRLSVTAVNMLAHESVRSMVISGRDITERVEAEEQVAASERRFRALVQGSSDLVILLEADGQLGYVSPSVTELVSDAREGFRPLALIHPDDRARVAERRDEWLAGEGHDRRVAARVADRAGGWRWYEFSCADHRDDPDVRGLVVMGVDITERRLADELLAVETAILEATARGAPLEHVLARIASMVEATVPGSHASVGVIGTDGVVRHPAAANLPPALIAALDATDPGSELGRSVRRGLTTMVFRDLLGDRRWASMHRILRAAGLQSCWVWPVTAAGSGELLGLLAVFLEPDRGPHPTERPLLARAQHIAAIAIERARFEARLEHQAMHDSLTGLPNRTLLLDRIEQALATGERTGQQVAVLFIDLDQFKVINDSLGHAAGDRLLVQVADRFRSVIRAGDTVGRFGGDEFVVLAYVEDEEVAVAVADRLAGSLHGSFDVAGAEVVVTCSIGIAIAGPRRDPEALVRDADAAMYRAKEEGRNRSAIFEERLHRRMVRRLELERDLRAALGEDRLLVHYQPRVRLADGRVTGVEALVRWDRPGRGLVGAAALIPVAEETGLIVPIGAWVLEQACQQGAEWVAAGHPLTVSVNLSARQLADPRLVELVASVLARSGFPPELLCLEVTESALAHDADTAAVVLGALKLLGVRLAIDDFGTGYATLDYVRRFSMADELKIDKSFVDNLADVTVPDAAIVSAAIVLANALDFDTVAEGVENPEQLAVLRRLGCQHAQGFFFSVPLAPEDILPFIGQ